MNLLTFDSAEALAHTTARRWLLELDPGRHQTVALSGGRIAKGFFRAIVAEARSLPRAFSNLRFFWADERCVPPDHPESNFGLARTHLLEPLSIPAEHAHRVRGEIEPELGAAEASAELTRVVVDGVAGSPVLDWVFLGMGEDGHIASLFSAADDLEAVRTPAYLAVEGPKPPYRRITLGYRPLAAARQVWVLVSGTGKDGALAESLSPGGRTPLARLLRSRRSTLIFSDVRPSPRGGRKF